MHQNGVNALDVFSDVDTGTILIVTGGEDNAISLTFLNMESRCLKSITEKNAHYSIVSGIRFIDRACFLSVSIDQRLKLWSIDWEKHNFSLEHTELKCIADISDLCVSTANR